MMNYVTEKVGIEIGGPSHIFRSLIPVYDKAKRVDGVNFSSKTIWEGEIHAGNTYQYLPNKFGYQFISDGTNLSEIKAESYEFLISSDCLEHIANPIKALLEWNRILKSNHLMLLVLPNKINNFDHLREFTSFQHIIDDFNKNTDESDMTHLREILSLHDLNRDPAAGDFNQFARRSLDNLNNRCLHHHVFNEDLIRKMLEATGFKIISLEETQTSFVTIAMKSHIN
jgi:ubiquinone/menaquinone biosynthesis C-methylase UbiE